MNRLQTSPVVDIRVEMRGEVPPESVEYARAKVLAVIERLGEPVLQARVKLSQEVNHAVARPALAQAMVDLNGRPARAHVAARTMLEAIDLLQDRLHARLARIRHHRAARHHHSEAVPDLWHGADGHEHRPQHHHRPAQERRIVRRKSFSLPSQTPWDAVFEMEAMDYGFRLFTNAASGRDSVVYRDDRTSGHRVASAGPAVPAVERPAEAAPGLTASTAQVPQLEPHRPAVRVLHRHRHQPRHRPVPPLRRPLRPHHSRAVRGAGQGQACCGGMAGPDCRSGGGSGAAPGPPLSELRARTAGPRCVRLAPPGASAKEVEVGRECVGGVQQTMSRLVRAVQVVESLSVEVASAVGESDSVVAVAVSEPSSTRSACAVNVSVAVWPEPASR